MSVLQIVRPEVDDDVVAVLEEALEKAKSGEFRAVALAVVTNDRQIGSNWALGDAFAILLGSTACMQRDIIEDSAE